jgi:hypothetical protein
MDPRSENDGLARGDRSSSGRFEPAHQPSRSERVREIRRRVADDAYRSDAVVDEIARRILLSREL